MPWSAACCRYGVVGEEEGNRQLLPRLLDRWLYLYGPKYQLVLISILAAFSVRARAAQTSRSRLIALQET